jgi:hypothetical protein
MAKPKDELRQMLESTLGKFRDDLKSHKFLSAPDTDEKAARTLLSEIEMNMQGTGLPGDPPKPWAVMGDLERWKEIAVWCLEKQLKWA